MRKTLFKFAIYFISIIAFILIYQLVSLGYNDIFIPSFPSVFQAFGELFVSGKTWLYLGNTLLNLLTGLAISFGMGLSLGIIAGVFKPAGTFLKPWSAIFKSIPLVVSIFIIMLLNKRWETPWIVCVIIVTPIIYEGVREGIADIDPMVINAYRLDSNLNFKVIIKIYIPMILSHIKTAFILAVGMGIKAVIMAEYLAGVANTLGYAIIPAANILDYASVYAYCVIMVVTVLLLEALPAGIYKIVDIIRKKQSLCLKAS